MNGHDDLRPFVAPEPSSIWVPVGIILGAVAVALLVMFTPGVVIW